MRDQLGVFEDGEVERSVSRTEARREGSVSLSELLLPLVERAKAIPSGAEPGIDRETCLLTHLYSP